MMFNKTILIIKNDEYLLTADHWNWSSSSKDKLNSQINLIDSEINN
tara:strand:- start:1362 stop:1499 length:138 start_codon:yes stop_codon:yes gene_type:complete